MLSLRPLVALCFSIVLAQQLTSVAAAPQALHKRPPPQRRALKTYLGAAGLCLVLGTGNYFYGIHKQREALMQLHSILPQAAQKIDTTLPAFPPLPSSDGEGQYPTKLMSRISYYEFVAFGGECLLALALLLGVVSALTWRLYRRSAEAPH